MSERDDWAVVVRFLGKISCPDDVLDAADRLDRALASAAPTTGAPAPTPDFLCVNAFGCQQETTCQDACAITTLPRAAPASMQPEQRCTLFQHDDSGHAFDAWEDEQLTQNGQELLGRKRCPYVEPPAPVGEATTCDHCGKQAELVQKFGPPINGGFCAECRNDAPASPPTSPAPVDVGLSHPGWECVRPFGCFRPSCAAEKRCRMDPSHPRFQAVVAPPAAPVTPPTCARCQGSRVEMARTDDGVEGVDCRACAEAAAHPKCELCDDTGLDYGDDPCPNGCVGGTGTTRERRRG